MSLFGKPASAGCWDPFTKLTLAAGATTRTRYGGHNEYGFLGSGGGSDRGAGFGSCHTGRGLGADEALVHDDPTVARSRIRQ